MMYCTFCFMYLYLCIFYSPVHIKICMLFTKYVLLSVHVIIFDIFQFKRCSPELDYSITNYQINWSDCCMTTI